MVPVLVHWLMSCAISQRDNINSTMVSQPPIQSNDLTSSSDRWVNRREMPFFIFKLPKYADNIGFNERISEGLYSQVMCRV